MDQTRIVLMTVVAESVLEHRIVRDLADAGARGWTVTDARGRGSRGIRADEFEGDSIHLESLVPAPVADRFLEVLVRDYFPHYAVVAWTSDVSVVRADKFT
jgi:nitrogen regulatory protein P-II 2